MCALVPTDLQMGQQRNRRDFVGWCVALKNSGTHQRTGQCSTIHSWWRAVFGLIVAGVCAEFGRRNEQAQQYSSALQHSYNKLKMDGCDKGSCNASVELSKLDSDV